MGYKQIDKNMTFAEISLGKSMENNRSLKKLERINEVINWDRVNEALLSHYEVGSSKEGADAYPPLMLLKGLLLQKWYRIESDPELENQINDRLSFKKFLGLGFEFVSPDHSTFSRFRGRLTKEALQIINSEVLKQFTEKGLKLNCGIAVDAGLIESASRPISKEEINKERERRETPEGKIDKNNKPVKFQRDIDSDWTVKNEAPHYGLKEHASVDTRYGFILAAELSPASANDSIYLPYCVIASCHTEEKIRKVYADKGYHGRPNREFLHMNKIEDGLMRKDSRTEKLTENEKERNRQISKKRYIVEQYFGLSHLHNRAWKARFTKMIKNKIDVMFRQMVFNLFRGQRILVSV
ncbi:MAG TPA: IS5 family transposase [Candidatus Brocadiaceae bacterium]